MDEKKPFNDVGEHYQKHVGGIPSDTNLKKMPRPIRLIGYFLIGCGAIFIVLFLFGWLIS